MSQWSTYGQPDPLVPFNEARLDTLAKALKAGSDDSLDVVSRMARLTGQSGRLSWSGLAADAFFGAIGDMPEDLAKLIHSYRAGYTALTDYSAELKRLRADADAHLEVINSYEWKIASLRYQLAAVPLEEEAERRDLERQIESRTDDLNSMVRQADVIRGSLDDAADRFSKKMEIAQDLGIHNRTWYVRFYQDTMEVWVEGFIGAWEDLGVWTAVLGLVLVFVPGGQVVLVAGAIMAGLGAASTTLKGIDILLSDDDGGWGYLFEVGLTAISLGAVVEPLDFASRVGSGDLVKYKIFTRASTVVDVVTITGAVATEAAGSRPSDPEYAQSMSNVVLPDTMRTDAEFVDPFWGMNRQTLNQLMTTPTLVDIDLDITVTSGRN